MVEAVYGIPSRWDPTPSVERIEAPAIGTVTMSNVTEIQEWGPEAGISRTFCEKRAEGAILDSVQNCPDLYVKTENA